MVLTKTLGGGSGGITQLTGDVTAGPGSGLQAATIPNDTVTYAKIQNVSATSRALGRKTAGAGDPEELTLSELLDFVGSAAQGDILYRGAATWARLGAGTSGQVLQTNGAGANPSWATPAGGGTAAEVLITETVVGVGGASSVSFTSIAATWRDLRVVVRGRGTTAAVNTQVLMRVNNDSSAIYDYERIEFINTSSGGGNAQGFVAQTSWQVGYLPAANAASGVSSSAEVRLYNYRGTAFHKDMMASGGVKFATGSPTTGDLAADRFNGWYRSTTAITRVDVLCSAGNFAQDCVVSLYGIL